MKYLGTSSKILIGGAVILTSTMDMQEILVRENITNPLHYQPEFHNIQRGARFLGSSIITTNIGIVFTEVARSFFWIGVSLHTVIKGVE